MSHPATRSTVSLLAHLMGGLVVLAVFESVLRARTGLTADAAAYSRGVWWAFVLSSAVVIWALPSLRRRTR